MELTTHFPWKKLKTKSEVVGKCLYTVFLDFERYLEVAILNLKIFQMDFVKQIILLSSLLIAMIRHSFSV